MRPASVALIACLSAAGSSLLSTHLLATEPSMEAGPAAPETAFADEHSSLHRELAAVRQELSILRRRQLTAARPAPIPPEAEAETEPLTQAQAPRVLSDRERQALLDEHLHTLPADPAWESDTERSVTRAIESREDTDIIEVACRGSMCRVELEHTSAASQGALLDELPFVPPFDTRGSVFVEQGPDGRATTLVYVAREGTELPDEVEG